MARCWTSRTCEPRRRFWRYAGASRGGSARLCLRVISSRARFADVSHWSTCPVTPKAKTRIDEAARTARWPVIVSPCLAASRGRSQFERKLPRRTAEEVAMNYLRTGILLAGLTALFMGVGYLIGGGS